MQKETDLSKRKFTSRHYVIRREGHEIYSEALSKKGRMQGYAKAVRQKIRALKKLLPKGEWSATIEQEWIEGPWKADGVVHIEVLDLDTLEIKSETERIADDEK